MSERTAEKEFDVLKNDLLNLLGAVVTSFKQKLDNTQIHDGKVTEKPTESSQSHHGMTILIGSTVMFGLGVLAVKLWHGRNR
ncbi:MAG: hypothetical protein A2293_03570 [Elusimicrobia bacterium RIFOXYB2_FULL_49_7]|nr:MAG: hypothetical protein A2293_03570 [Elusimicrobia bacterium RIFOXYB2_FULL_49_7]